MVQKRHDIIPGEFNKADALTKSQDPGMIAATPGWPAGDPRSQLMRYPRAWSVIEMSRSLSLLKVIFLVMQYDLMFLNRCNLDIVLSS